MRNTVARLEDILEAIQNVEEYVARGHESFLADRLVQSWIVQQLQNIGEAANYLPTEWLEAHPETDWSDIVGMRHRIVHGYFNIRLDIVWTAATIDLPILKRAVEALLADHKNDP